MNEVATRRSIKPLAAALCALGVAWLLAACASAPPPPPPAPPAPQMRLTFWAATGAATPPGATAGQNACGGTLTIPGAQIPRGNPAVEPAKVHQLGDNARVLRSWSVPINLIPVAVDGTKLLLQRQGGGDPLLEVGADGAVAQRSMPQLSRPQPKACPTRPAAQYAADVLCVNAVDISNGQKLLLEFEEPCS